MAPDLETVVKQLADSGIIGPGKLENFVPPKADPKTVEGLLAALVKQHHLTPFQAAQINAGKAKAIVLGEYTILDKIGAGGMGQVFKATHRRMDRTVAIKMLPPSLTKDAAALARFEREARAAAKLSHPNIVTAFDAGHANRAHFLVMEYVAGQDLAALVIRDGPLPVDKAVNYILQAARGLEFAHRKGVVHRDIKPANLLLDCEGVVKILDMGLARVESDGPAQTDLTGAGAIMGTVDYMAPEQAQNAKDADYRADIYSLGCTLYYLLSGRPPYSGATAVEKLMAHQTRLVPSLRLIQSNVSPQLDAVFSKMVAKRIEDRQQSMREVIEALEGLGPGGSGTAVQGNLASTLAFSFEDRKKLASPPKKSSLSPLTEVVASEKTKHVFAKVMGGTFATVIAPILVTYLLKYVDEDRTPPNPPVATVPAAMVPPAALATNTTTQPSDPKSSDGRTPMPPQPSFGAALKFAGSDVVEIPSLRFDSRASYTWEACVTSPQKSTFGKFGVIMGVTDARQNILTFTKETPGSFRWKFGEGPDKDGSAIVGVPSQPGRTCLAAVHEGTTYRLFVDGKLFQSKDWKLPVPVTSDFVIGERFVGVIDEVRISKSARYQADFTPQARFEPDADTIALYHFDEGAGSMLKDSSGNNHHGKITGAKWIPAEGVR
jgi:serine/threonine protein kinase